MTWKKFIYWSEHKLNKKFKYATGAWAVIAFYPRKARNLNTIKESKRLTYFSSGILLEGMFLDLYIISYVNTQREHIKSTWIRLENNPSNFVIKMLANIFGSHKNQLLGRMCGKLGH